MQTFEQYLETQFDQALREGWSGKWLNQKLSESYEQWKAQEEANCLETLAIED